MHLTLRKTSQLYLMAAALLCLAVVNQSCNKLGEAIKDLEKKNDKTPQALKDFNQVNLVGNNDEYKPAHIDAHLINAWGIAFSSSGIAWVSAEVGHISAVYDRDGNMLAARPEVAIPSPTGTTGGSPTGQTLNIDTNSTHFKLSNGASGRFLFAGSDGVLSGWNGGAGNNALVIKNNSATSAYTGLTMAKNSAGHYYLYAANFKTGKIDVWDTNFVSVQMLFHDAGIPSGYAPFNIQSVSGLLYVMYAKVGDDGDEEKGAGLGYVDIYSTNGNLEKRLVSKGQLNAPWGVAWAPAAFFKDSDAKDAILIGNFGDGHINVYNKDGDFQGQLRSHGNPIEIDGLWALMFPPSTSTIDPNRLYFTAGPDDETEGLFGYIIK